MTYGYWDEHSQFLGRSAVMMNGTSSTSEWSQWENDFFVQWQRFWNLFLWGAANSAAWLLVSWASGVVCGLRDVLFEKGGYALWVSATRSLDFCARRARCRLPSCVLAGGRL